MICQHMQCTCSVDADSGYCSAECRPGGAGTDARCVCGHVGCAGADIA